MSFGFYSFVSMDPEAVMKPIEKATEENLVKIGANVFEVWEEIERSGTTANGSSDQSAWISAVVFTRS